jgi:hypothetical protein
LEEEIIPISIDQAGPRIKEAMVIKIKGINTGKETGDKKRYREGKYLWQQPTIKKKASKPPKLGLKETKLIINKPIR